MVFQNYYSNRSRKINTLSGGKIKERKQSVGLILFPVYVNILPLMFDEFLEKFTPFAHDKNKYGLWYEWFE